MKRERDAARGGRPTLMLVEWLDAHSPQGSWIPVPEMAEVCHGLRCRTVGWLTAQTREGIVLSGTLGGEQEDGAVPTAGASMFIPAGCIVRTKKIALDRAGRRGR